MKKVILFSIALLAGFLSGTAQYNISSQIYSDFEHTKLPISQNAKSVQDWWEPDTIYIFPTYPVGERIIYKYNSQGFLLEQCRQYPVNTEWENTYLFIYSYDSNNNLINALCYSWEYGTRDDVYQISYTYDSNNNMISDGRTIRTYDSNNNILTEEKDFSLYTHTYDSNNNLLTSLEQKWRNNSWEDNSFRTYTYDSFNNMKTYLRQLWRNNSWENFYLIFYFYDSNNIKMTELTQSWENNSWVNSGQDSYIYDLNNNLLARLSQCWQNNSWVNCTQTSYTYSSSNDRITELFQLWINNSWLNYSQRLMTYDENNNCTSVDYFEWKNECWNPVFNHMDGLILTYNNRQSVTREWDAQKLTASYKKVRSADTGIKDIITESPIQIHSIVKTIQINNETGKNAIVSVYGITGIKVAEQTISGRTTMIEIPFSGFYLVSVKAENEKPVTKKIIIN